MKKLYVGNLSFNANENDLTSVFEPYGTVDEVKVITDRDSGRSKGFGFITMSSPEEAKSAINGLNETEFMGRNLRVSIAEDKPKGNRPARNNNEGYRSNRY